MRPPLPLARLFESRRDAARAHAAPYRTLPAELDAVRAGDKAISMFPLARPGDDPTDDAFLRTLLRAATARGLGVLVQPGEPGALLDARVPRGVTAYALLPREAWRVPALEALWRTAAEAGGWSDASERQLGFMLGYGARERRAWMAQLAHRIAAWGARTVYALLDRARLANVEALGRRGLGPPAAIEGMSFFVHARGLALRRDAARRMPRGLAIARVGLAEPAYARLFGSGPGRRRARSGEERGVIAAAANARAAAAIAAGLRSNVGLLTVAGWR